MSQLDKLPNPTAMADYESQLLGKRDKIHL